MKTKLFTLFIFIVASLTKQSQAQIITTVAGNGTFGYTGNGAQATNAELNSPFGITVDIAGNFYFSDANGAIRKVNTAGIITGFAGCQCQGYSGDGGQATAAELYYPWGVSVDAVNNIYIADGANNRIRKVIVSTGIINTMAGSGIGAGAGGGYSGDGGQASVASLNDPYGVVFDAAGNLYIADTYNNRIRMVTTSGIISTIAGNGTQGYIGDGGQATDAELTLPQGVAVDAAGNIYIVDGYYNRIRKVTASTGIISSFAGDTITGYTGDGGPATAAELDFPHGVAVDAAGNIYIADTWNNVVRKVNTAGIISTIVGNGTAGIGGDGGTATLAELNSPAGLAFDVEGNLYIADYGNSVIRKVTNIGQTTGMEQVKEKEQTIIYPNPSNGSFQITNTSIIDELQVCDILGQIIYVARPKSTNTTLQIEGEGIYFVSLTSGVTITTKKVIVR